jgi:hypothetical protein
VVIDSLDDNNCALFEIPFADPIDGGAAIESGDHTLQLVLPLEDGRLAVNVALTIPEIPRLDAPGDLSVAAVSWIPTPANEQPRKAPAAAEAQREGGLPVALRAMSAAAGEIAYVDDDGLISVVFTGDRATSVERGLVATRDGMVRCEVCSLDLPEGSIIEIWAFSTPRLVAAGLVDERGCIDEMIPLFAPLDGGSAIESGQHTLQVILPMDDGGGRLAVNVGVTVGLRPGSLPAGEGVPTGAAPMGAMFAVALAGLLSLLRRRGQGLAGGS